VGQAKTRPKIAYFQQPIFTESATLRFVIPSAAEGSGVRHSPKQFFSAAQVTAQHRQKTSLGYLGGLKLKTASSTKTIRSGEYTF
jgi:hypothetical protein